MNSSVTIRISRNRNVAENRAVAILKLNKITHYVGQPVMVKYYAATDKIDTILALGIKDGIGEDCYKLISLGGLELIRDVVTDLPDVSLLVHGELYLYQDETNAWNYVYEVDSERIVEKIENLSPTVFVNIEDRYRWFWDGKNLKREDDFKSSEEMGYLMDELFLIIGPPKLEAASTVGYIFETGTTVDIPIKVNIKNAQGVDISDRCSYYIDGKEVEKDNTGTIIAKSINSSTDLLIEAKIDLNDNNFSYSTILPVEFGYPFYYGRVSEDWILNEEALVNLENKEIQSKNTIEYKDIVLDYQKIVYSYPEFYGELIHIYDEHGFDCLESYYIYKQKLSNGLTYIVYIKEDPIIIGGLNQSYLFSEEDKEELPGTVDEEKYDAVVKAWDLKNTPSGIVTVGQSGKISSSLVEGIDFTSDYSFTQIVAFLDHYPEKYNFKAGEKWYNTVEKKIFEATTSTTGIITSPIDRTIYVNKADSMFYLWIEERKEMMIIGESISTTQINKDNIADILD